MEYDKKSLQNTYNYINNIYDNLTFYELYSNSIIIFILITLIVFLIASYCYVMTIKTKIASNWNNERCNPINIPFAGLINKPNDKTILQYTSENFNFCTSSIFLKIITYIIQPFVFLIYSITNSYYLIDVSINNIRLIINNIRTNITNIIINIINKVFNVLIVFQQIIISLKDSFNKLGGVLSTCLYFVLALYYTFKSLMGSIAELIIKTLIILSILILSLWASPVTWGTAVSMTILFLSIATPFALILIFMKEVLHIKTSTGIPKLRCFDKNIKIRMKDGSIKKIINIKVGDVLYNNIIVKSKIKVLQSGLQMFNLYGIIVSESHIVKYDNKWISVSNHPDAKIINNYNKPYLYCLNTSTKEINLYFNDNNINKKIKDKKIIFTDWDEIYDLKLNKILNYSIIINNKKQLINNRENIDDYLFKGFNKKCKVNINKNIKLNINKIKLGTIIENNELNNGIIYGIVILNLNNKKYYNLLVSNKYYIINNIKIEDYNSRIDKII